MKKAVFLDRDGTIIVDKIYLNDPAAIEYYSDSFSALKGIAQAGYSLIIVTNQSGVARGLVTLENLSKIHSIIAEDFRLQGVTIAAFYYAPYAVDSGHPMRKPEPGMLLAAAQDHQIDLAQSWMIGDRMTDVEAGHRAGVRSLLLKGTERPEDFGYKPPFAIVDHLSHACSIILEHS